MNASKLANVEVTLGVLATLVQTGLKREIFVTGVPADADFVGAQMDYLRRVIVLTFSHESFAEVANNNEPPYVSVLVSVQNRFPNAESAGGAQ